MVLQGWLDFGESSHTQGRRFALAVGRTLARVDFTATGAHFSSNSASLAVSNLSADTIGKIEGIVHPSREGAGCTFHFAPDLAAGGLVGELEGREAKDEVEQLVQTIVRAVADGHPNALPRGGVNECLD